MSPGSKTEEPPVGEPVEWMLNWNAGPFRLGRGHALFLECLVGLTLVLCLCGLAIRLIANKSVR